MFKLVFLAVFAVLPFEGLGQLCPVCPDQFTQIGNKCYRAFTTPLNWEGARDACHQLDAHLVVVHNASDNEGIQSVIEPLRSSNCSYGAVWTSGRRKCPQEYVWATGYGTLWPVVYTNWNRGEPNNARGDEHCIAILQGGTNPVGWNDESCGYQYCYLCEYDV